MGEGGGLLPHKNVIVIVEWGLGHEWICHTDCNDDLSMSRLEVSEKQYRVLVTVHMEVKHHLMFGVNG